MPDANTPTTVDISISSYLPLPGKWIPQVGAPDFSTVNVASGRVAYQLYNFFGGTVPGGLIIVELTDAAHLKVEVFPNSTATDAQFDSNAYTYIR